MPALALTLAALVAGCGGKSGSDDDPAQLRVLNLASDVASVDLALDDTKVVSATAQDTLSPFVSVDTDSYDVDVLAAGGSTALNTSTRTLAAGEHYTAVVWGRESALMLSTLPEDGDEDDITSGSARLRVFNATTDVGALDVYLTRSDTALEDTTPHLSSVASAGLSSYASLTSGTWRLRITGAGDPADLRLDIPSITLADKKFNTLVLTAGSGGVLVHASLYVQQQAGLTTARNTQARLRVLAGVNGNGTVGVNWNGSAVAAGLRSPAIGPYALVEAGEQLLELRVNGSTVASQTLTLAAGADYSLMAWGESGTPRLSLLNEDNRLPSSSSRAKLRLVHGASQTDALTLSLDYAVLVSALAPGQASSFVSATTRSAGRVDVSAASSADALFVATDVNLQSQGVYSVFLLGGNSTPTGVLRKER